MPLEILQHDFMVRAFIVGIFTAVSAGILWNFVVAGRQAMVSDMLAHTALVGVGLGIYFHISPSYMWLAFTFLFAVILWLLIRDRKQAPEAISVFLLTGGIAMALLLVHINKNSPVSLDTYLFGSILTVTQSEMQVFIMINVIIVVTLLLLWRPFLMLVFDSEFLQARWKKNAWYEITFLFLIASIVGVGLKVVWGLLIWALLVAPVLISSLYCRSFRSNVISSIVLNVFAIILWIVWSYYFDIPTSSSIVLVLILLYLIVKLGTLARR